jgi:hypothetical protein
MSLFTLSVFRSLEAMFGADADVGFREQATAAGVAGNPADPCRNVALQRRRVPISSCWTATGWRSALRGW